MILMYKQLQANLAKLIYPIYKKYIHIMFATSSSFRSFYIKYIHIMFATSSSSRFFFHSGVILFKKISK